MSADATNRTDVDEPNQLEQAYLRGGYVGWLAEIQRNQNRLNSRANERIELALESPWYRLPWLTAFRNHLRPDCGGDL